MASTMHSPMAKKKILKSGWLRKQGGVVKSWHRRWFILNGDILFYFAREDDTKSLGTIFLPGNRVIEHSFRPDEPEKFLFEILPGKGHNRMTPGHESYLVCTDNDAERQDWIKKIRWVMYSSLGGAIFGQRIEDTMMAEKKLGPNRKLPYIIEQCVEFITEHGLDVEGIFRLPGRTSLMRELKERFDCGERLKLDISEHDVHSVASTLKMYFRELPESIIPSRYYQKFMNVALRYQEKQEVNHIDDLRMNLTLLPEDNYNILKYLCKFIHKTGQNVDVNKMSETNLATVFGPNIIRHLDDSPELFMATADLTHQLVFLLVHHHDDLFTIEFNAATHSPIIVDDLLGMGNDDAPHEPLPSSDILCAVTDQLGIEFDKASLTSQTSSLLTHSTDTAYGSLIGLEVGGEVTVPTSIKDGLSSHKPNHRGLTLSVKPVPPKRKVKPKKKYDGRSSPFLTSETGDRSSVSDTSSVDCTPTSPDRAFDIPQFPESTTNHNGPASSSFRGHTVYSEDANSVLVLSSSENGSTTIPLSTPDIQDVQQENTTLKEALSKTRSKYEGQQKSLLANHDNLKEKYEGVIANMKEQHVAELADVSAKLNASESRSNETDTSGYNCDNNNKLGPSVNEMHRQVSTLKDELIGMKFKYDTQVNSLKSELVNMRRKYDAHIMGMERRFQGKEKDLTDKFEAEKASRAKAVAKIVSLQAQLHEYQMTYGELRSNTGYS